MPVLTRREIEILDAAVEVDTLKHVALELSLSPSTVYNVMYRLKRKQNDWRRGINLLLGYRRKSKLLNKILGKKKVSVKEDKDLLQDSKEEEL